MRGNLPFTKHIKTRSFVPICLLRNQLWDLGGGFSSFFIAYSCHVWPMSVFRPIDTSRGRERTVHRVCGLAGAQRAPGRLRWALPPLHASTAARFHLAMRPAALYPAVQRVRCERAFNNSSSVMWGFFGLGLIQPEG